MQKLEVEMYRENNIRLMKCHIGMLILYLLIGVGVMAFISSGATFFSLFMLSIPVFLHLLLAYGSYKKIELSRKASVVVFVLLAIGVIPIGTILSIFIFLPATQWKAPQDS